MFFRQFLRGFFFLLGSGFAFLGFFFPLLLGLPFFGFAFLGFFFPLLLGFLFLRFLGLCFHRSGDGLGPTGPDVADPHSPRLLIAAFGEVDCYFRAAFGRVGECARQRPGRRDERVLLAGGEHRAGPFIWR